MGEQERKPMLLRILWVLCRILLPLLRFIEPKPIWHVFRAIAGPMAWVFGYDAEDVPGHPLRIEFRKKSRNEFRSGSARVLIRNPYRYFLAEAQHGRTPAKDGALSER